MPRSASEPFGLRLGTVRAPSPGPASRALAARLGQVESRNVTYTDARFPVFWERAKGANVEDADGNVYVDLTGAFGVAVAGHAHPHIVKALHLQSERLIHGMGDVHPPSVKVDLLERLCALTPWDSSRAVLASAGSEAVEIALKTALLATGRSGVVAFDGGYHGLTLGALSVTERDDFRAPFLRRLPGNVTFVPFPESRGATAVADSMSRSLMALERSLSERDPSGQPPGCVILEPIQGRGGVRVPPEGFLTEVARRTREAGALLILDEIFTGFGRTGSQFAFQDEAVVPDLLCVGKALGGGLPLSACVGSEQVMEAWPPSRGEALHTSTFLGHPCACATALAFLDVLEREELARRAAVEGRRVRDHLRRGLASLGERVEVRGRGLMIGIDLGRPGAAVRVATEALGAGLLVLPAGARGEVVELTPPLNITREQLDWAVEQLRSVIVGFEG